MKKSLFFGLVLSFCLINCLGLYVYAENKDVEAKYEVSYNMDLVKIKLDNNAKSFLLDNYELKISTSMKNIEVIIFKASGDANNYAKSFTDNDENYYLIVNQFGKKIESSNINIQILSDSKVLNVYSNIGKLLEKSNEKIYLNNNDYFIAFSDYINVDNDDYVITDDGNGVDSLEDIQVSDGSKVEIYNSKNIRVNGSSVLGTNYKVVVKTKNESKSYKIVVKGDTTGDARINLNDITRLYHYYKGIEEMDNAYILAGDVANNKLINLNDVTKLYHYYKHIISDL